MEPAKPYPPLQGTRGRADLLYALALAGNNPAKQASLAAMLDYRLQPGTQSKKSAKEKAPEPEKHIKPIPGTKEAAQQQLLFRPYHLVAVDDVTTQEAWQHSALAVSENGELGPQDRVPWNSNFPAPRWKSIVPWTRLWPKLREAVARVQRYGFDIPRLAQQLAYGQVIHRLPRNERRNWPKPLPVILDFSDRLTPYWNDWHWLRHHLQHRLKKQVHCYHLHGVPQNSLQKFRGQQRTMPSTHWPSLTQGDTLLIVSDLGMQDPAHPWPITCWKTKLTELKQHGINVIVISPASTRYWQAQFHNLARHIRLSPDSCLRPQRPRQTRLQQQRSGPATPKLSAAANRLLAMMSVATRIEPALLRALRACLLDSHLDAGLEGEVWCYRELDTAATACALSPWAVQRWRDQFRQLPSILQERTLDCLRKWHAGLPQAIHHEENLLWQHLVTIPLSTTEQSHADDARRFFGKLAHTLQKPASSGQLSFVRMVQMADRHVRWAAPVLKSNEPYLNALSHAVIRAEPQRGRDGLPQGIDPMDWIKSAQPLPAQTMHLIQYPNRDLNLSPAGSPLPPGVTCLATLEIDRATLLYTYAQTGQQSPYRPWPWHGTSTQELHQPRLPGQLDALAPSQTSQPKARFILHTGQKRLQFAALDPWAWASAWGQDQFGLFAELTHNQMTQRFRWIAPGTFMMGSPLSEPGRYNDETQHEVTLSQGFWLADTTVTQAFWLAVMPKNPARFKDNANNPVDNISWDDTQDFIARLNSAHGDLSVRLPTEAEWEYACRAGRQSPFSFGDNITPEQVNYNGNHPYADGQKGLYREATVGVKSLPPNPWGLYEMHGNVWEWCADWYDDYPRQAVTDPTGPDKGTGRVLRGGAWRSYGRYVRAACRNRYAPGSRYDSTGFRLALG